MAVKIRLSLSGGRKKRPFFYIVACDERSPRDGRFIEKLGYYNPNQNMQSLQSANSDNLQDSKDKNSKVEFENKFKIYDLKSINNWIKNGAQLSEKVAKMLFVESKKDSYNQTEFTSINNYLEKNSVLFNKIGTGEKKIKKTGNRSARKKERKISK